MALLLSGERPSAAAVLLNPFRLAAAWVGKVRAAANRRQALHNLLQLDDDRLRDLGIERSDLFDAMAAEPARSGRVLAERRASNSRHWLNP